MADRKFNIKWPHNSNETAVLNSIIEESSLGDYLAEPIEEGEEYEVTVSVRKL